MQMHRSRGLGVSAHCTGRLNRDLHKAQDSPAARRNADLAGKNSISVADRTAWDSVADYTRVKLPIASERQNGGGYLKGRGGALLYIPNGLPLSVVLPLRPTALSAQMSIRLRL